MQTRRVRKAPEVFVRRGLKKTVHREMVTLKSQRPATCHNGCGLFYLPPQRSDGTEDPDARCADCGEFPKLFNIGQPEDITVAVSSMFGNVSRADVVKVLGAPVNVVERKPIVMSPRLLPSNVFVLNPQKEPA